MQVGIGMSRYLLIGRQVYTYIFLFTAAYVGHIPGLANGAEIDTTKYPVADGYTLELCAGIVDKDIPLEEVAREEVLEECGYDVPASRLKKIFSFR